MHHQNLGSNIDDNIKLGLSMVSIGLSPGKCRFRSPRLLGSVQLAFSFGRDLVFGGSRFKLFKLQFHLLDQPGTVFGAAAILLAPQLSDLHPEVRGHRLGGRQHRAGCASSASATAARASETANLARSLAISASGPNMPKLTTTSW